MMFLIIIIIIIIIIPKQNLACENSCFSSLLATGDVLQGGTSAT